VEIKLLVATVLSLGGGLVSFFVSRPLLREIDSPAFPERYLANRILLVRLQVALATAIAFLAHRWSWILLPLFAFASSAGAFPARRRLLGEEWRLSEYLRNRVRLYLAAGTFWVALMATPTVLALIGHQWWPAVIAVLTFSFFYYQELLVFAFEGKRITDPSLLADFEPILARSNAPRPEILEGGAPRSRWTNAFTLPRGARSKILIARNLIRELDRKELSAIFAHELAHVEQYTRGSLSVRQWLGFLLIPLLAVIPSVLWRELDLSWPAIWEAAWPVCLAIGILGSMARRQELETAADLRALELGVSAEALISGLEKLHALNRFPRRVDPTLEKKLSHPTLARRIAAIRRAAGFDSEAGTTAELIIVSRDGRRSLRLDSDSVEMLGVDGAPLSPPQRWPWGELRGGHVRAALGGPQLRLKTSSGNVDFPLRREDVGPVQEQLDRVDDRFVSGPRPRRLPILRLLIAAMLVAGLLPGIPFAPSVVALFALFVPAPAALAALAAASLSAAAYAITAALPTSIATLTPFAAAVVGLSGLIVLVLALRDREALRDGRLTPTLIFLGVATLLSSVPMLLRVATGTPVSGLLALQHSPSAALFVLAGAAALAKAGRARQAVAAAAVAVALLAAGSSRFLLAIEADPLLVAGEPAWTAAPKKSRSLHVAGYASSLRVSPDGGTSAVYQPSDERSGAGTWQLRRQNGAALDLEAIDFRFVSDSRALRLRQVDDDLELALIDVSRQGEPIWAASLPPVWNPQLSVAAGRWSLQGMTQSGATMVRFDGGLDSPAVTRHPISIGRDASWRPAGDELLFTYQQPRWSQGALLTALPYMLGSTPGLDLWQEQGGRRQKLASTALQVQAAALPGTREYALFAANGNSTHVTRLDAASKRISPLGRVAGRSVRSVAGDGGVVATSFASGDVVVWNVRTNRAFRIAPEWEGYPFPAIDLALANNQLAILAMRDGSVAVDFYPISSLQ
jgi:Zn-dependent protease with chaperone function